jgi:hypothetical protein
VHTTNHLESFHKLFKYWCVKQYNVSLCTSRSML